MARDVGTRSSFEARVVVGCTSNCHLFDCMTAVIITFVGCGGRPWVTPPAERMDRDGRGQTAILLAVTFQGRRAAQQCLVSGDAASHASTKREIGVRVQCFAYLYVHYSQKGRVPISNVERQDDARQLRGHHAACFVASSQRSFGTSVGQRSVMPLWDRSLEPLRPTTWASQPP